LGNPTPDALDDEFLDHLAVEFADHGQRAVEFLRTAAELLDRPPTVPRLPNLVSYCLREALESILKSHDDGQRAPWRQRSRAVVDARQRFELARGLTGEDAAAALQDLFGAIDEMAQTHDEEGLHQRRLIIVMARRAGFQSLTAGGTAARRYQKVLSRATRALHGELSSAAAVELWNDSLAILRHLFLPPAIRNRELDRLATLERPDETDLSNLRTLLATDNHLRYLFAQAQYPHWLTLLADTDLLEPPTTHSPWPVFTAIDRLQSAYADEVAAALHKLAQRWGANLTQAGYIAQAAQRLGDAGKQVLLGLLKRHRTEPSIAQYAVLGVPKVDAADPWVEAVADIVLERSDWNDTAFFVNPLMQALCGGINATNALKRVGLLCFKLRQVPEENHHRQSFAYTQDRFDDVPDYARREPFYVLLQALGKALVAAAAVIPVAEILRTCAQLPDDLLSRARAWLLAEAPTVDVSTMVAEVSQAITSRSPTADDARLIERVLATATGGAAYDQPWAAALGDPPEVAELGTAMSTDQVPRAWLRIRSWCGVLPSSTTQAWSTAVTIMSGRYGPPASREALTQSEDEPRLEHEQAPITEADLQAMPPEQAAQWIAAWRPPANEWMITPRALGRTLQTVVAADTARWATTPLAIATQLRHPTYLYHYLQGLADAESLDAGVPIDELVDLITLVHTEPWPIATLSSDRHDYDQGWRSAKQASMQLIKALSRQQLGFHDRNDEVWAVLRAAIEDRSQSSGLIGDTLDPLETAINRPCTIALDVALSFLDYEYRQTSTVRPEALELMSSTLTVEGRDGAEYRAILASRLGFLRYLAPDWMDQHRELLFGDAAPDGLGPVTVDLALRWGQPNKWMLETCAKAVKDAVVRQAKRALTHYLVGMLWDLSGYSVEQVYQFLKAKQALSAAGGSLAQLLDHDNVSAQHIDLAVQFWRRALQKPAASELAGFGFFAKVANVDHALWAELTAQTVTAAAGRVDLPFTVAERTAEQDPVTSHVLIILNGLVRGATEPWDEQMVAEHAVQVLRRAQHLASTLEYQQLHTALSERGYL
jgi:hypothetical protein